MPSQPGLFPAFVAACCLAVFTAIFLWDSAPASQAADISQRQAALASAPFADITEDTTAAEFGICGNGPRFTCVVDGDTIWLEGTKIRIADINTPEVTKPECQNEARLGLEATARLTDLLNEGQFSVEPADRDQDDYGRKLRVLSRNGESLGMKLVEQGLAEQWNGERIDWC